MRITDLLDARSISLQAAPGNKEEALNQAVELMTQRGNISDKAAYRRQVGEREKESTTGIGEGIAIPHGKCAAVSAPGLAAMVIPGGVDFDSLDGEPVTLLFLIAAPDTEDNIHLDVLGKLSMLLMDEEFTQRLRGAGSVEEFIKIIDEADEEKLATQNSVLLVGLLYKMCKVNLVKKAANEDEMNSVNKIEVESNMQHAQKVMNDIAA